TPQSRPRRLECRRPAPQPYPRPVHHEPVRRPGGRRPDRGVTARERRLPLQEPADELRRRLAPQQHGQTLPRPSYWPGGAIPYPFPADSSTRSGFSLRAVVAHVEETADERIINPNTRLAAGSGRRVVRPVHARHGVRGRAARRPPARLYRLL